MKSLDEVLTLLADQIEQAETIRTTYLARGDYNSATYWAGQRSAFTTAKLYVSSIRCSSVTG